MKNKQTPHRKVPGIEPTTFLLTNAPPCRPGGNQHVQTGYRQKESQFFKCNIILRPGGKEGGAFAHFSIFNHPFNPVKIPLRKPFKGNSLDTAQRTGAGPVCCNTLHCHLEQLFSFFSSVWFMQLLYWRAGGGGGGGGGEGEFGRWVARVGRRGSGYSTYRSEKKAVIIGGGKPKYVPVRKFRDEVREAKKPALNIYGLAIYFIFQPSNIYPIRQNTI